jgi:hypothetical protein
MIHILYAIAAGMAVLAVFGYCVQTRRVNALIVESNDLLTRNVQLGQRYQKLTASSQRLIADVLELSRSSKETVISLELMTEKYKKLTGDYCTLLEHPPGSYPSGFRRSGHHRNTGTKKSHQHTDSRGLRHGNQTVLNVSGP